MREASKRRGRPPKKASERKRNNVTTRLRDKTKRLLETEAEKAGRSLSEEIEFRLEQSFSEASALVRAFGDNRSYRLARLLFGTKDIIEEIHERSIFADPETFRAAHTAMCALMEKFAPVPGADLQKRTAKAEKELEKYLASMEGMENQLAVMASRPLTPDEQAQAEGYRAATLVFGGKLETGFDKD